MNERCDVFTGAGLGRNPIRVLGMSPSEFMSEYWGRRPLLVPGAFTREQVDLVTPDELAGLAVEDAVVSRIVSNVPTNEPESWPVEFGPFDEKVFQRLPEREWTLLVQEVDRWIPDVASLTSPFRFIPNWRFDDIMVSFATAGGGVGAHVDRYDVFLIQGSGTRTWRVGARPLMDPLYADHEDLKLLASFEPEFEWTVKSGDLIYLPPMVGHEGVATSESLTYSVGFRLPGIHDIVFGYVSDYLEGISPGKLLNLPRTSAATDPGLLGFDTLDAVRSVLRSVVYDEEAIDDWFGRYVTGRFRADVDSDRHDSVDTLTSSLAAGGILHRVAPLDLAYVTTHDGAAILYASGNRFELGEQSVALAALLCGIDTLNEAALAPWLEKPASVGVLRELLRSGVLEVQDRRSRAGSSRSVAKRRV